MGRIQYPQAGKHSSTVAFAIRCGPAARRCVTDPLHTDHRLPVKMLPLWCGTPFLGGTDQAGSRPGGVGCCLELQSVTAGNSLGDAVAFAIEYLKDPIDLIGP